MTYWGSVDRLAMMEAERSSDGEHIDLSPRAKAHAEKAKLAMQQAVVRAFLAPEGPESYMRKLQFIGRTWRRAYLQARGQSGLTIDGLAGRLESDRDEISLFLAGYLDPQDLKEGFVDALGAALGRPDLAQTHGVIFGTLH